MPVDLDLAVLAGADHGVAVHVDPEADAVVGAADALHDLLGLDVPEDDVAVLASGRYEGLAAFFSGCVVTIIIAVPIAATIVIVVVFVALAVVVVIVLKDAEAAADAEPPVLVALVRLLHLARHVVP